MKRLLVTFLAFFSPSTVFAAAGVFTAANFATLLPVSSDLAESMSAQPFPVIGSTGFVWTAPQSAQCVPITAEAFKNFKSCRFSESGAFGLPLAYHTCERKQGGELLAFRSMKECREALETMQANAP